MFDVTIQVGGFEAVTVPPSEDDPQSGHVIMSLIVGLSLPGLPPGMTIPVGAVRTLVGREAAIANAKELLAAAEALPEAPKSTLQDSGFVVANSLDGVDKAVAMEQKFRG